uniref:Caspase-2 n=1 Tax=Tetraodon nigroviridis TaxID=99883 RepID=H3CRJ0_TETNG
MLQCGMVERDAQALKKQSAVLFKQLVVDELLIQFLQADDILTDSMAESILAEQTSHKRCWKLLHLLPKRGPKAFSSFCSALRETDQKHLCDLLARTSQENGNGTHLETCVDSSVPLPTQEAVPAKRARTQESMEISLDADSPINTPVCPCTPDFYHSHSQQSYKMTSSPRGLALVISNVRFSPFAAPDLDPRQGGEVDDEVLRKVFTELDYLVTVQRDLTAQGIKTCIENFSRRPEHQSVDSCVVCLLSHGVEGAVYGVDGKLLQLDWVFTAFDNAHCPLLQNKPKMFFIQACRGGSVDEMDCGVEQIDGPSRTGSPSCEQRDAGREGERPRIKLPQRSDMILRSPRSKSPSGTAAMRNTKRGSWFIQELNKALRLHARDKHLCRHSGAGKVNSRIKEREGHAPGTAHHRCKEMSEYTSSLCKDLFLFPKYQPQY